MKQFIITSENEGQRLDKYLSRILSNAGTSFIYKMLRKKNFVLNDKKATGKEILKCNDCVKLYLSDDTYEKFKTNVSIKYKDNFDINNQELKETKDNKIIDISKDIVYEDNNIILLNKRANMLSQKTKSTDISVNELVTNYLLSSGKLTKEQIINYKPSAVNRLDRNTTGIIIIAKTLKASQFVSQSLKNRTIKKYYKCVVPNDFDIDGKYSAYLTKNDKNNTVSITKEKVSDSSEYIETEYKKISYDGKLSTVEVHLITGKSHQIRAHLSYLGFPIIGDRKYGNKELNNKYKAKHQLLHAYKIVFPLYEDSLGFEFSNKTFECKEAFRY